MAQVLAISDPNVDRITAAILTRVAPRRVVLIGSRARGDAHPDSDYDIVVEVDDNSDTEAIRSAASDSLRGLGLWVEVLVCTTSEVERWQDDPGMLHWDISREGVLLHPRGTRGYERMAPRPLVVREREPDSVAGWLERADVDLAVIETLMAAEKTPWAAVAFHAQQAAEKYLKAVLVQRWIKPPHRHDLNELLQACRDAGIDLPDLSAECELLNKHAVDVRYPFKTPLPDAVEGRRVADAGLRVVTMARALLGR